MKGFWVVFFLTSALFSSSCVSGGSVGASGDRIPTETIFRSTNCPSNRTDAHLVWIDSQVQLQQLWENMHRTQLMSPRPVLPEVSFSTQGVLMVHMGRRSTGGYALELADPMCRVKNGIVSIAVNWISPESGAAVIQMITAPCILLKLPNSHLRSIEVIDQHNQVRATVDMSTRVD